MTVKWRARVRKVLTSPPQVTVAKISLKIDGRLRAWARRRQDRVRCTYNGRATGRPARLLVALPEVHPPPGGRDAAVATVGLYLQHRFDVLGSGWVEVHHGMTARGLEGHRFPAGPTVTPDSGGLWLVGRVNAANLQVAQQTWQLTDPDYRPIDWHIDVKSGFRWPEATWYRDVRYGEHEGVDVKVPWELARCHHLPQLALAYAAQRGGDDAVSVADACWREFRNQILDFVATNPPRYGVNWSCAMDVAIRITNWLVAYDVFRAHGAPVDPGLDEILVGSVLDHGRYIVNNLEWSPELRSNHYLADVAGLLVLSSYAPPTDETDAWFAFATHELLAETKAQFTDDGANFEASTAYHRLSAEMVVYATAFALIAKDQRLRPLGAGATRAIPLPHRARLDRSGILNGAVLEGHLNRIARMAWFTHGIVRPDGDITQIGDNDSGRFLKLTPAWTGSTTAQTRDVLRNLDGYDELPADRTYWLENPLDHDHLLAAIQGLLDNGTPGPRVPAYATEHGLLRAMVGERTSSASGARPGWLEDPDWGGLAVAALEAMRKPGHREVRTVLRPAPATSGGDLTEGLRLTAFVDMGIYVFRSERVFLLFRCGPIGQAGNGGHAHNDQLSIELVVDGADWFRDPGTYLYTPDPAMRNAYRSVRAHWAPRVETREPAQLDVGLFRLSADPQATVVACGRDHVVARHSGFGPDVVRSVVIGSSTIEVVDMVPGPGDDVTIEVVDPKDLAGLLGPRVPFSRGYGLVIRAPGPGGCRT